MPGGIQGEEHPIEEAPEWLREIMTPTHDLTAMHERALRYLAGDRTVPVGDERGLMELLDELDRRDDADPA
jgi:hypothetical protein